MHRLKLPPTFWDDYYTGRGLPPEPCECKVVKATRTYVIVELDDEALADLKDDAGYYCDPNGPDAPYLGGIKTSARATLKAIIRQT